ADDIQRAQGFPDLFVAGIDGGDFGASGNDGTSWGADRVDAAADRRADFERRFAVRRIGGGRRRGLKFGDDAALADGGPRAGRVDDAARAGREDVGRLQERDDLGAPG